MPKTKENEVVINLKVPKQLKYDIKMTALKEQTTMQDLLLRIINDYCRKDEDWDRFIKAHDNAPEEDPTPEDLEAIERGRKEIEAGEVQDFEEAIREIENEG